MIAIDAALSKLHKLRIERVSVVTPGWADQGKRVAAVFAEHGVVMVRHVGMERGLGNIGNTSLDLVAAALRDGDHHEADAIVQLGTNLPTSSPRQRCQPNLANRYSVPTPACTPPGFEWAASPCSALPLGQVRSGVDHIAQA